MSGNQHVWIIDQAEGPLAETRAALTQNDVVLSWFPTVDAAMTQAKSPQTRLPRLLVVAAAQVQTLRHGEPQSSPRAALLGHAPFLVLADAADDAAQWEQRGAMGVVAAPPAPETLGARIVACLVPQVPAAGEIQFNVGALTVVMGQRPPAALTPREFQILSLLYRAAQHTATRTELFANVWSGVTVCNKVLDVHVSKLRKKLVNLGVGISFIRPSAYRLDMDLATSAAGSAEAPAGDHKLVAMGG